MARARAKAGNRVGKSRGGSPKNIATKLGSTGTKVARTPLTKRARPMTSK